MNDLPVCRNCGYFIQFEIPKEPEQPRWAHTPSRPDKPADNHGPCKRAEPL